MPVITIKVSKKQFKKLLKFYTSLQNTQNVYKDKNVLMMDFEGVDNCSKDRRE